MRYENVLSTCPYCGTGCNLYLQVLDGEIVGIRPVKEHPVSQGKLCIKGWSANEFITHKDRLRKPMIRVDGKLQEASWYDALCLVAQKLGKCAPAEVAVLSSAKTGNEDNYLMQKFTRGVLKTNNIDHCARL
jgi:predicted molibdopterin-dependent oxidoreductase YjgC